MKTLLSRGLCVLFFLMAIGSAQLRPSVARGGPGPGLCFPDYPCT